MQPTGRSQSLLRGTNSTSRGSPGPRVRGRGRGSVGPTLVSQQSHGATFRGRASPALRGSRGSRATNRGGGASNSQRFGSSPPIERLLPYDIAPDSVKPHNPDKVASRREQLKAEYEGYREAAISSGLMSSDEQSSIDQAIKTRGTCTDMCDPKERVDRIFQNAVDIEETLPSPETGHPVAIEGRMVKKFRRAAAGVDRQIPQELRTPKTLQRTLDYLFREIIGKGDRYGKHHKFVWDRSRAIRNDFNIQSFSKPEDVRYEVDCYERIVRFHILSLHVMSEPEEQQSDEEYNRQQELEQLQKTFASLMDKYDSFGRNVHFKNEPEFRAYYILFVSRTTLYDVDTVIQLWPKHVLEDGRVKTALRLHEMAGNVEWPTGSSNLDPIPPSIAQANAGSFWTLLQSQQVGYLMACVAEISFQLVRFTALQALWRSAKNAPKSGQSAMRAWSRSTLTDYLGFDEEDQTEDFIAQFAIAFTKDDSQEEHLDFRSIAETSLERMKYNVNEKASQVFSYALVEQKRQGRTYEAVLNGFSIAAAGRKGMIIAGSEDGRPRKERNEMFVQDDDEDEEQEEEADDQHEAVNQHNANEPLLSTKDSAFNAGAAVFTPGLSGGPTPAPEKPNWMINFGASRTSDSTPTNVFGLPKHESASESSSDATPVPTVKNVFGGTAPKQSTPSFASLWGKSGTVASPIFPAGTPPPATNQSPFEKPISRTQTHEEPEEAVPAIFEKPSFSSASSSPFQAAGSPKPFFSLNKPTVEVAGPEEATASSVDNAGGATTSSTLSSGRSDISPVSPFGQTPATKTFNFEFGKKPTSSNSPITQTTAKPFQSLSNLISPQSATATPAYQAPAVEDSTSSATLLQKPSESSFHSVKPNQRAANTNSVTPAGDPTSPADSTVTAPPSLSKDLSKSTLAPSKISLLDQPTIASPPEPKVVDKATLVANLCRIGLVQQNGILEHFAAVRVNQLVQEVFAQLRQDKISELRKQILSRKWFYLWQATAHQRRLRKRADRRRKLIAAAAQADEEKRRRNEFDLAQIANAQKEKQQILAERKKIQEEESIKSRTQKQPTPTDVQPHAGQKRKTLANSTSISNFQGIAMSPMHKRSRTVGNESTASSTSRPSSSPSRAQSPKVILGEEPSSLRRSLSQKSLQQCLSQQRVDTTRTDYFRLKAMGLDPNGPAFSTSRKGKEKDQDAELPDAVFSRSAPSFGRSKIPSLSSSTPTPAVSELSAISRSVAPAASSSQPFRDSTATIDEASEDPVLKAARLARESFAQDTERFKTQYAEWARSLQEQEEELKRSQNSNTTNDNSFAQSINGFARSINGPDYVPAELKAGQSLSRTEERIRRTGARGLATKPIGGTPAASPSDSYVPVAMSKHSASALHQANASRPFTNGTLHGVKRSLGEEQNSTASKAPRIERPYNYSEAKQAMQPAKSKPTMQALQNLARNPFALESSYDDEDEELSLTGEDYEEDDEEEYEDEDEEAPEPLQNGSHHRQSVIRQGYGETYAGDEEEYEEDEDEEPEEEEDFDFAHMHRGKPGLTSNSSAEYEDDRLSASRHDSRAVSASAATPDTTHGSTAADAIELDSD